MARHHSIGGGRGPRSAAGIGLTALLAAVPAHGASTTVVITEVEADPVQIGFDAPFEWFELRNIAGLTRTLSNWTIADNQSTDILPTIVLEPDECIVVCADSASFRTAHPGYTGRLVGIGSIGTGLENLGDLVVLRDNSGTEVDCVSWGTNVTCFSPAVTVPVANTVATLQRAAMLDSDTAADWTNNANETPCPGGVGVSDPPEAVGKLALAITPNPCFGRTTISCSGAAEGPLVVAIHDAAGRRVRALRDESSGPIRNLVWDGLDEQGRAVPAGVYLVKLAGQRGTPASGRLLLLR